MPNLIVDDWVEAAISTMVQGVECVNVVHYRISQALSGHSIFEDLRAIGNAVSGNYATLILPSLSRDVEYACTKVRLISPGTTPFVADFSSSGFMGGVTSDSLPSQSSVVTQKIGEREPARNFWGRMYTSGMAQEWADGGRLLAVVSDPLTDGIAGFLGTKLTVAVGGEAIPVVYSRTLAAVADIVDARSDPVLRTIRERRAICVGYALGEEP